MKFWMYALSLALVACGSGPCHEQRMHANPTEVKLSATKPADRVRVYKADGSKQCGMGKAIELDEMKKELAGIQVYSNRNQPDGLMHPQVCGAPTGQCNVYEINRADLDKAKKVGFKEWSWD